MKRVISGLGYILFALIVLLPLGTLLTSCLSYVFKLVSITFFAIVIALISVSLVVLSIIQNQSLESRTAKVLFALLAPLSIVNAVFYMLENSSILVIVCMLSCIGCSIFLTTKHGKPILLKTVTLTLSSLAILKVWSFIGRIMPVLLLTLKNI